MSISQTERTKTTPRPACAESQIPLPAGDQFVAIRGCFLRVAKGDACAAALLNVLRFVYDVRYREGEPEVFQRTSEWWVESLQGLYSKPTIRKAFVLLRDLGFVDIKADDGAQSGNWYRLNVDALVAAINGTTQQEVADTPKNLSGSHIYSSRALDPSPDPLPDQQQQADLKVTGSAAAGQAPPAAAADASALLATIREQFPSVELSHACFEEVAARGYSPGDVNRKILELGGPALIMRNSNAKKWNPVVLVRETADALDIAHRLAQPDRKCAGAGEERPCGPLPAPELVYFDQKVIRKDDLSPCSCGSELFVSARGADGEAVTLCSRCDVAKLSPKAIRTRDRLLELRANGLSWEAIRATATQHGHTGAAS